MRKEKSKPELEKFNVVASSLKSEMVIFKGNKKIVDVNALNEFMVHEIKNSGVSIVSNNIFIDNYDLENDSFEIKSDYFPIETLKILNPQIIKIGEMFPSQRITMKNFPDDIHEISNLTQLTINGIGLSLIPDGIGLFSKLKILSITYCNIEYLPPEIGKLNSLILLNLEGNALEKLPKEITNLSNLISLNLKSGDMIEGLPDPKNNKIRKLPDEIGNLKNLEKLYLTGNEISKLPKSLFELVNLRELDLSGNKLTKIGDEIIQLKNLKLLNLSYNSLMNITERVVELKYLRKLTLRCNNFVDIPNIMSILTKINSNLLYEIEACLTTEIFLHKINVEKIYRNVSSSKGLVRTFYDKKNGELAFRGLHIEILPEFSINHFKIKFIDISSNELTELPTCIESFAFLECLDITNNPLKEISIKFSKLKNIRTIFIDSKQNHLFDRGTLSKYKIIDVDYFGEFTKNMAKELSNKSHIFKFMLRNIYDKITDILDLSNKGLVNIPIEIIEYLNPKEVDLSYNSIKIIPDSINQFTKINRINLNHNLIKIVPNLKKLKNLKILNLKNNDIMANTLLEIKVNDNCLIYNSEVNRNDKPILINELGIINDLMKILTVFEQDFTMEHFNERYNETDRELNLSGLNLDYIPSILLDKLKLLKLNLSNNNIKVLDENVNELKSVKDINLSFNKLEKVPSLNGLVNLEKLDLSNNKIIEIDDQGNLNRLINLDLSFNKLTNLTSSILKLHNLEILDLSHNSLSKFFVPGDSLSSLKRLILSNNKLEEIDASIGNLINLEVLKFLKNNLNELPNEMRNLKKLKKLFLFGEFAFTKIGNTPDWALELMKNGCFIDYKISRFASVDGIEHI